MEAAFVEAAKEANLTPHIQAAKKFPQAEPRKKRPKFKEKVENTRLTGRLGERSLTSDREENAKQIRPAKLAHPKELRLSKPAVEATGRKEYCLCQPAASCARD